MSKIVLSEPVGPYEATIDTGVMEVEIRDAYLGVGFVTDSGDRLSVCMRDGGFEVRYRTDGTDSGWADFKNGTVAVPARRQPIDVADPSNGATS